MAMDHRNRMMMTMLVPTVSFDLTMIISFLLTIALGMMLHGAVVYYIESPSEPLRKWIISSDLVM